jgi:alpha-mannosidase
LPKLVAAINASPHYLLSGGQLHFANGGWVMHDEACTHYVSMVDQTTLGHRFLLKEFGYVPRAGWQIDPFGHSSTQAALLSAGVGFDSLFFARIDYEDRRNRKASKAMEFVWQASPSLGEKSRVWTSVLDPDYGPLEGFCFDELTRCPTQEDMHDSVFWNNTQVCLFLSRPPLCDDL